MFLSKMSQILTFEQNYLDHDAVDYRKLNFCRNIFNQKQ